MKYASLLMLLLACSKKSEPAPVEPPRANVAAPVAAPAVGNKVELNNISVMPKGVTQVRLAWSIPKGTALNEEAPVKVRWHSSDGLASAPEDQIVTGNKLKDGVPLGIELTGGPSASLTGTIKLVVCDDVNHAVCVPVTRDIKLGFVPNGQGQWVTVPLSLPSAK